MSFDEWRSDADRAEVVAVLTGLWVAALDVGDPGPEDDFFDLGGSSLAAVQLVEQINSRYGTDFPPGAMFGMVTMREMAEAILARGGGRAGGQDAQLPA